jgi:hypothetical protein
MRAFIAGVHFAERPHHHYSDEECKKRKNAPEGGSGLALIVDEKGMPQEVYVIRHFLSVSSRSPIRTEPHFWEITSGWALTRQELENPTGFPVSPST